MSPDHTAPRTRRGKAPPPTDAEILNVPSRLETLIAVGVGAMESSMDSMTARLTVDDDALSVVVELCEKASEILGRVNRAREAATRRKPTMAMLQKSISDMGPDDRATLMEWLSGDKEGNALG